MVYYVSHCYQGDPDNISKAAKITHDLQINDQNNCYFCPLLAFSHMEYGEIGYEQEMELCLDLLSVCDALIVASQVSEGVRREIEFAKMVNMEVIHIAETDWRIRF